MLVGGFEISHGSATLDCPSTGCRGALADACIDDAGIATIAVAHSAPICEHFAEHSAYAIAEDARSLAASRALRENPPVDILTAA